MVSLTVIILLITSFINMASADCSYVANYRYSWRSHIRYVDGPTIIDGHCSSNTWIENGTSYESHNHYCDNNQVFINLFIGSECEEEAAVTGIPVTSYDDTFSYSCNGDSECNNYFLFRPYNSSFTNYDFQDPPTECIDPGSDVLTDTFDWKALINVCYSVDNGSSEINTCNATGGYQWYHEGSNCDDQEPQLIQFAPVEGCVIRPGFNGTDDHIFPYGKLTYCGDDTYTSTTDQPTTQSPTTSEPSTFQLSTAEPSTSEPSTSEPSTSQPTISSTSTNDDGANMITTNDVDIITDIKSGAISFGNVFMVWMVIAFINISFV